MFAVKNNSSASTLSSSITNRNTDAFIQPKMNENASENNKNVEADQAANQTISKNENTSSSFFSSQPTILKESEEEVQKQDSEETQQTASETTVIAKSIGGNNTPSKEEGEGKLDQQKNEGVSDTKGTSPASTGEGQINSDTTTGADVTTTSKTASQSTSNSVEKTEESTEEDKEDGEKEKVKEAAIPKAPTRPEDDPAYKAQIKKTEDAKTEKSQHPDPITKVGEQKAAGHASPASQTKKGNQEAHAESLNAVSEKKREPFTPKGFKEMLKQNLNDLEKQLPKNSDEAKEFRDDKPIDGIKENISGQVTSESDKLAGPMKQEADKPAPDVGVAPVEAAPLPPTNPGTTPKPLDAKASIPKPKTSQEISMEKESQSLDDYMAENEIKDEQLAISNEPKFTGALEEKNNAQKEAKLAPVKYRKKEKAQLSKAQKTAATESTQGLDQMQAAKLLSENNVLQNQTTNKDSDKTEKEKIYAEFEKIYNDTKKTVTDSLEKLSDDVDKKFSSEAESAQKSFEKNVEDGLGDIYGWTVVDDWLFGEDTEAIERLFRKEKSKFISKMDTVLDDISVIISDGLNAALDAIAEGKRLSKEKFDNLDESQKKLAEDAFTDFNDQYAELEDTVYEKQEELAQGLAKSYKENVDSLREKFDEIKEKVSAGWIGAALNALAGVVKAIMKIKDLLLGLLSAAVSAIGAIISDPIGFLSNLISGIKQGFENFGKNIKKNIIQGLIEWLTGSLGDVGIQIPDNLFSLSGIFSLVTQMLGLTWDYFRGLAVKMLGESVVAGMEKAVEIFTIVKDKGVEGLWDYIKEQFSNLKEMVMDAIRDMVITKVIEAGIKWVLGLMSPAGAFVKAAMMIIDIVKFFVERAAQIFELVQAFINSIKALAAGNVSAVAKGIEQALTKAIPVLIGFLASLVGITGLTGKVQKIIKKVRKKIDKAMKKIILKAKKAFNKILGKKKPKKGDAKKIKDDNKNQKADKITAEDRAKHKKIGKTIKKKLDEKPEKEPKDFKEFYNSKLKKAKALEDKYQPQLKKGINLDIVLKKLSNDEKDDDVDIKITIKPNNYEEDFAIELSNGLNIEFSVTNLIDAQNDSSLSEVKKEKIVRQIEKVKAFETDLVEGEGRKSDLIEHLRGKDKEYTELQGFLYLPFIEEHQKAVASLQDEMASGSYAEIFAIERGGAALAEQIASNGMAPRLTQHVMDETGKGREKKKEIGNLIQDIRNHVQATPEGETIKITVAETFVGGGSASSVLKQLRKLIREFPNLHIKLLVLKQTLHTENNPGQLEEQKRSEKSIAKKLKDDEYDTEGDLQLGIVRRIGPVDSRIQVAIASTRYILGEDVNFQSAKKIEDSNKPVIIFNGGEESIKMIKLSPKGETTARDIITGLVKGDLNHILDKVR